MVCIGCATYFAVLFNHVSVTRECDVFMVRQCLVLSDSGSLCQGRVVFLVIFLFQESRDSINHLWVGPLVCWSVCPIVGGRHLRCLLGGALSYLSLL